MYIYGLKNVKVAIEASTNYSYIVDALVKEGYEILVAHPLKTRAIADAKIKSDKIDAKILADLTRGNLLPTSWIPPKEIRELRDLVRQRIFLARSSRNQNEMNSCYSFFINKCIIIFLLSDFHMLD